MAQPIDLTGVSKAAEELQKFCESRNWKFCFIGGLAVQAWALPRATIDADITLLTGFGGEEAFVDELLANFQPRYPDFLSRLGSFGLFRVSGSSKGNFGKFQLKF